MAELRVEIPSRCGVDVIIGVSKNDLVGGKHCSSNEGEMTGLGLVALVILEGGVFCAILTLAMLEPS
jgi:hypothetical protein